MRNFTLLAAAPLALLAACGDDADEAADSDAADTTLAAEDTAQGAADDTSGPATALADAGDYSGTYSFAAADGNKRSVTLNSSDKTYRYTADDGTVRTGTYTLTPDGYRLYIGDYLGSPAWFAYRNNSFYRLPENVELDSDLVVRGERYVREETEVFSREPEPGSPVVPEDLQD